MSNLRFNTDAGRSVHSILLSCQENIAAEIQRAESQARALVPADWEAPAAFQFEEQAEGWAGLAHQSQERLAELSAKLIHEIEQWEATAAALSA